MLNFVIGLHYVQNTPAKTNTTIDLVSSGMPYITQTDILLVVAHTVPVRNETIFGLKLKRLA